MTLKAKSPKVVRQLLAEGFSLIGAGRGRIAFGKPGSPIVFKVTWRMERTGHDMNETEWDFYQSLPDAKARLVVPIFTYDKLIDGNSILTQAACKVVDEPNMSEQALAEKIMDTLQVAHDHITRNFGYYNNQFRILDIDSPIKKK